jgi:uncharacterized protein (DUF2252 family)
MTVIAIDHRDPNVTGPAGDRQAADPSSASERRMRGKALRDAVPRHAHAGWKAPRDRPDPIELLIASNEGRLPELVPIRFGRMMQSPFTFYRGSAGLMAADLATTPSTGLRVQACGDAHLMNFGGFATPERRIVFDINDLDETLPAPWEWDLKRLAASMVLAARDQRFSEAECARIAEATVRAYRHHMTDYSAMSALEVWYETIGVEDVLASQSERAREKIRQRVDKARQRSTPDIIFPKLAEHRGDLMRIRDEPPLIFHPSATEFPALRANSTEQLAQYRESLPHHVRVLLDRYRLVDVAIKVVGIGSVGTICGLCLFAGPDDEPLFLQIKEARQSVLEPYAGKSRYANDGQRVVEGQRLMQSASDIFLGWYETARGNDAYIRQLRDAKISAVVEEMDESMLRAYGKLCAWALAKAHGRSGDAAAIAGYVGASSVFDEAVTEFAVEYADQAERDYGLFVRAVRAGRLQASEAI